MAPDGRTERQTDGRKDGRTEMDKLISLRLRRGIITEDPQQKYCLGTVSNRYNL